MIPGLSGTSFFLDFHPLCRAHQMEGNKGELIREEIAELLLTRFMNLYLAALEGGTQPPVSQLRKMIAVRISPRGDPSMNHGEIYLWLKGIHLSEDFVFALLKKLKYSLDKEPLVVRIGEERHPISFYGWGFRYI